MAVNAAAVLPWCRPSFAGGQRSHGVGELRGAVDACARNHINGSSHRDDGQHHERGETATPTAAHEPTLLGANGRSHNEDRPPHKRSEAATPTAARVPTLLGARPSLLLYLAGLVGGSPNTAKDHTGREKHRVKPQEEVPHQTATVSCCTHLGLVGRGLDRGEQFAATAYATEAPDKRRTQGTGTDETRTDASGRSSGAASASVALELSVDALAFSSEHGRSSSCQTERPRAFLLGPDKDGLLGHQRVRLKLDRAAHLPRFDEVFNVGIDRLPAVAANAILHGIIVEKGALDALEACCNFLSARVAALAGALAAATLMLSHTGSVLGVQQL
eukprot:7376364-Prymnesium_polylepis.1